MQIITHRMLLQSPHSTKGFSLIEILVTLFVFSIGLLGVAAMQLNTLKLSHDSHLRSVAAAYASSMADRIRANYSAVGDGISSPYNNPSMAATARTNCLGMNASGVANSSQCTPQEMAEHDFYEWYAQIKGAAATGWSTAIPQGLPNGDGVVCIDSTPEDGTPASPSCDNILISSSTVVFTIKLWWTERIDNNTTTHRYVMSFAP